MCFSPRGRRAGTIDVLDDREDKRILSSMRAMALEFGYEPNRITFIMTIKIVQRHEN